LTTWIPQIITLAQSFSPFSARDGRQVCRIDPLIPKNTTLTPWIKKNHNIDPVAILLLSGEAAD
jgi:hypothetical protein